MNKISLLTLKTFLLLSACVLFINSVPPPEKIRVAVFPLPPLNFIDSDGTAQGLLPDLIRALQTEENWDVTFVPGTWSESLERLQAGEVDLMTTVAYTPERAEVMDFNQEATIDIWGQIFTSANSGIETINDLHGRRVGIMNRGMNGQNFISTADKFGVKPLIVKFGTHEEIFAAISAGEILAGVAPQHYGLRHATDYNLVPTTIIFSPFPVYFATKKDHNKLLLYHIDEYLKAWKADPNSVYQERMDYWMHAGGLRSNVIPKWFIWIVALGSVLSVVLIFLNQYLNYQVRTRTREIELKEKQYRDLVEGANSVILRIDLAGRVIFVNSFGINLFGYKPEELVGIQLTETLLPEIRYPGDDLISSINLVLGDNKMYKLLENVIHCKAGNQVNMQWSNKTIYDSNGAPRELLAIGTDITEKKNAEAELARTTSFINAMFDGIPDVIIALDTDDRIASVNKASRTILGWDESEIMGDQPSILFASPDQFPYEASEREKFLKSDSALPQLFHYRRRNGEVFPGESISVPLHDADQTFMGKICIIRDVTEKQSLENQVRRSQKLEALGIMVGGIAHDFNNILQSIMLSGESALAAKETPSEYENHINDILKDSDRAKKLIQQVLTFGRKSEVVLKPVNIQDVIREALVFERSNFPKSITIKEVVDKSCPPVLCDDVQMHQVLINILNNAMHAIGREGGEVEVKLGLVKNNSPDHITALKQSSGEYLELIISDTGCGMDDETRLKIFDPFFSTKVVGQGTGLGLSVVHSVVKNIDGWIDVESVPGEGSVFYIWLPVTDKLPQRQAAGGTPGSRISKFPILFVDDEVSIRVASSKMLRKRGFTVDTADNGLDALGLFKQNPGKYGLVLTDLNMPKMSGVDLAENIRSLDEDVPIVLSSGDLSTEEMTNYKLKGVQGFIQKPWSVDALIKYIGQFTIDES